MKIFVHFRWRFLALLSMLVMSACAGDLAPNDRSMERERAVVHASPTPAASAIAIHVPPATIESTPGSTEPQPVPGTGDTSGSSEAYPLPFIKPADSDTPAAGICGAGAGEIVPIKLGAGPDGLPLGGRCIQVTPLQRIELTNPTSNSLQVTFSVFDVAVPAGGKVLLDKPVGEYLARGVHFLPHGPEIWLIDLAPTPVVTVPPPIRVYMNSALGYYTSLPGDWLVDETGMSACLCKEVIFSPPGAEPFVGYLSISIDSHRVEEIEKVYAEYFPDARKTMTTLASQPAIQYTLSSGRVEWLFSHEGYTFRVFTDRPGDVQVQAILAGFGFTR